MHDSYIGFDPFAPGFAKHDCPRCRTAGRDGRLQVEVLPSGLRKVWCDECDFSQLHTNYARNEHTMSDTIKTCSKCQRQQLRLRASGMCRACDPVMRVDAKPAAEVAASDCSQAHAQYAEQREIEATSSQAEPSPESAQAEEASVMRTVSKMAELILQLREERAAHETAIREIDAGMTMLGINPRPNRNTP